MSLYRNKLRIRNILSEASDITAPNVLKLGTFVCPTSPELKPR